MSAADHRLDTESPARWFITGALLINAGVLFWLSRDIPMDREPIWMLIGALLVALIAAIPGIAVAVKPTPLVVKACAGVALSSAVVIGGVAFFGYVATAMNHNGGGDNSFIVVVLLLLLVLQLGVVIAASVVLQRSFIDTFSSAIPLAFAAWFAPLLVHAWIGFMRNMFPMS
jgi:hypothetical protein